MHSYNGNRSKSGFTIVELLIVIVVIGILAAIVIVAYNGVQSRASTSRTLSMVSSYQKALMSYKALNGTYPTFSPGVGGVCLGTGYSDRVGNDGIGDCGELNYALKEDATFNNILKTLIGSTPIVNDKVINMPYQSDTWVGASFHNFPPNPSAPTQDQAGFTVNSVSNPCYMMFIVDGNAVNCAIPGVVMPDNAQGGWPKMTSVMSGQKYSWTDGKTTACVIALAS